MDLESIMLSEVRQILCYHLCVGSAKQTNVYSKTEIDSQLKKTSGYRREREVERYKRGIWN